MKLKRRLRGVVKTMIKCTLDVLENSKNNNIVNRGASINLLTILIACEISKRVIIDRSDYQPTDGNE